MEKREPAVSLRVKYERHRRLAPVADLCVGEVMGTDRFLSIFGKHMKVANALRMLAIAAILLEPRLVAADLLRLESRFLGDGLFEYVIDFPDDRYFDKVNFDALSVVGLSDQLGVLRIDTPQHWTDVSGGWRHDQMLWEPVPYRTTFRIQTTTDAYRKSPITIVWAQHWYSWAVPEGTPNTDDTPPRAVAFANLTGLSPCLPAESDGSLPEWVSGVPGYPEVKIERIVMSEGKPVGIRFRVGGGLPVVVEASEDLKTWVAVGSVVGASGVSTWASAGPLNTMGTFFRVAVKR